jgi:hypothetical protein
MRDFFVQMLKQKFGKKGGIYIYIYIYIYIIDGLVVFFLSQFCDVAKVAIIQKQL